MVAGITLGELYTDNLTLAANGSPQQSGWVTQVQPFFKWARSGPRLSGMLDYKMTGYLYAGQSRSNQLAHDLKTRATLAVVEQHLFVDGMASYRRELINNELASGQGTFFLNNNSANVATASLSPYWIQDLGNVGVATLRYTFGRVMYDSHGIPQQGAGLLNGLTDITSQGVQFNLVSPESQTLGWNIGYSDQRIDPDVGNSFEYALAKLGTSWQISNATRLLADVGKETRFLPDGTSRKWGASFWDAGFSVSNTRDHLKLLVGHRFYGRSYEFSWTRSAALLTTMVSYVEQPTDLSQQLLGQNLAQSAPLSTGINGLPSLRQQQVYLMKRGSASVGYEMPTGRLQVTLYDERRTYFILDNHQEKVANGNVDWLFNIGPFTTLTPTVGWQRYQFEDGQTRYNRYAQVVLAHQLNPKNFAALRLRHDSNNVSYALPVVGARTYGANVIFLQLTHLF
ncbi:TIGR03016 family PEP-CTERM system-associated outer membrane protein [Rhodanobacter sp. AS-Z3]|uniref:TIGR03016 family PEP-CTERM system-associated outer membrane protein n=1 Tax=Rhodanobacter sp. AS-Z3 TaxID=3031330 RepID=UPI002479C777|nr:TIGR03016 family PEP-CTERM system-associated outer membrane protein [Rhodanobacter sp. AS-Z3]WEN15384.1 TIGR03016 family PEP-CTERM system-associated outer membrane protein [Rhodanobacter sp. AS-Z3]